MYMCVYSHVCSYVLLYVYVCLYIYGICVYRYVHIGMNILMCTWMCVYVHKCSCVYIEL